MSEALKRFSTGTYVVWYPVKDAREVSRFMKRLRALGLPKVLNVELAVCGRDARPGLNETGVVVINPPYVLAEQLAVLMPALCTALAVDGKGGFRIDDWSK